MLKTVLCAFLMAMGQLCFKSIASEAKSFSHNSIFFIFLKPQPYLAILLYGTAAVFWILELKEHALSIVYPLMLGLSILFVILISRIVNHEHLSLQAMIGIILLVGGSAILVRS